MRASKVLLGEVCEITMGQAPSGESYNTDNKGFPLIAGAGDFGDLTPEPTKFTTAPTKLSRPNEVILCIRATIGDRNWSDRTYCLGRGVAGLLGMRGRLDERYLWHWIGHAAPELKAKGRGATFLQVSKADIASLEIPLPPLPEQRRIAAILDKADALRAKRREAIAKLDQLLQSVFLDMFGDPKSNPYGFPVRELSEFYINANEGTRCGPFGSALKKSDITESGIPLWNMDNILSSGQMQLPFRAWVSKEKAQELDSYRVTDGDILISRAGTVGKMCVARMRWETSLITTNLIRLRLGHQLIPEYFVALMTYCKGRVGRLRTGPDGAFTHMSTGMLDKLSFPYPAISQQRSWVDRSAAIQGHKAKLSDQLERMTRQFESISARAFSGAS